MKKRRRRRPGDYNTHPGVFCPHIVARAGALTDQIIMSDEEYYEEEEEYEEEEYEEEEEEEEEEEKTIPDERKSVKSAMSEGDGNFLKARQEAKKGELDDNFESTSTSGENRDPRRRRSC